MKKLIELYEMVSLNDGALHEAEKVTFLKARLALRMFERAMENFTAQLSQTASETESFVDPERHPQAASAAARIDDWH